MRVLVGGYPHEDAGSAAAQRRRRVPGPFQALPRRFQHQPLLRIDPHGLARGDAEEFRIESVDPVEESAAAAVDLARGLWIRVVELVDVEAVLRDLPDRIDTAGQHAPRKLPGSGAPGKRHATATIAIGSSVRVVTAEAGWGRCRRMPARRGPSTSPSR